MQSCTIPKLIYGTAWKKENTSTCVIQAIESGFGGIDTACQPRHYREDLVGDALVKLYASGYKREDIFLQTKFTPPGGQDFNTIPYDVNASVDNQVLESFEVSKKNLKTTYVDSLVLHSPIFPHSSLILAWKSMEKILANGEAKHLGISNCYELSVLERLHNDSAVKPSILQNRFYADSNYDKDIRVWCKAHDVTYQSFWSLTANPHILSSSKVSELAKKYSKTPAQIMFRFLSSIGIVPLIGSISKEHIMQDLGIFEFELTNGEIDAMNSLL